jgi:hypothetical protein
MNGGWLNEGELVTCHEIGWSNMDKEEGRIWQNI